MLEQIRLIAHYNKWINRRLYSKATELSEADLFADKGAFFHSLFGTLNHIAVADILWLKRFASHPAEHPALDVILALDTPQALDTPLCDSLAELQALREHLDHTILRWSRQIRPQDLEHPLTYSNSKGQRSHRRFVDLVMHFFNHQTHHRGQATTLLSQFDLDVGVTDLLMLIPEVDE